MIEISDFKWANEDQDIASLNDLFNALFEKSGNKQKVQFTTRNEFLLGKWKTAKIPWNHIRIFTARLDGKIVGMVMLFRIVKWHEIIGKVEYVAVLKRYRSQGIAKKLMEYLIKKAKEDWNVTFLELTCAPQRVAANRLYQKLGFKLFAKAEKNGTNYYRLYL